MPKSMPSPSPGPPCISPPTLFKGCKAMNSSNAIQVSGLKKTYGSVTALRGVDLEIPTGEFFGLLGPNGAGKTTLINSVMGLVKPQEGGVCVFCDPVGPA